MPPRRFFLPERAADADLAAPIERSPSDDGGVLLSDVDRSSRNPFPSLAEAFPARDEILSGAADSCLFCGDGVVSKFWFFFNFCRRVKKCAPPLSETRNAAGKFFEPFRAVVRR